MALRDQIWEIKLDAEYNAGYYKELSEQYVFRDKSSQYLGAILGTSAFASIPLWEAFPFAWKGLLVINSLFALSGVVFRTGDKASQTKELSAKWSILASQYDSLWNRVDRGILPAKEGEIQERFDALQQDEHSLIRMAVEIPIHDDLRTKHTKVIKDRYPITKP